MTTIQADQDAERATLGGILLLGTRAAAGLSARGLRPDHFYWEKHASIYAAMLRLADRQAGIDPLTVCGELDRLGLRSQISRVDVDELAGHVPVAGNYGEYADRVMEIARWRERNAALLRMSRAVERRDGDEWAKAAAAVETATAGSRTESYSPKAWAALLFDHFSNVQGTDGVPSNVIRFPWPRIQNALGGGLWRGEWMAISGPTNHGKSPVVDQVLDLNARAGYNCHLYMTEMTAVIRGMRYLARRTGVPFMKQRRGELTEADYAKIMKALTELDYGVTIAAGWSVDDIVQDALAARYDLVAVDLLHGFHYEDERGLDRLSKAMTRLARVSTTIDGHPGTAVMAVAHLKEEGLVKGQIPRPGISSIKGGSSIKQDSDFVLFVWQEQDGGSPTGEGEIYLAKGRSGEIERELVRMNRARIRWDVRQDELVGAGGGQVF